MTPVENTEENFGAVVRSLRTAAGMTQEQLAQALTEAGWAVRQNTIAKLENGLRPTTVPEMYVIAAVFEISPRELVALIWPPDADDDDESARFALKHSLAVKRTQLRASQSELAALELEAEQLRHAVTGLAKDVSELEEQIGEHQEEA
jgi:transcriptional regulator with XRE-family HTH domain